MWYLGVAIPTNGRCPPLLGHLVERWLSMGAEVAVAGEVKSLRSIRHPRLKLVPYAPGPQEHGCRIQAAFDALSRDYVLLTDDDVLPVDEEAWHERLPLVPRSIHAIRLLSVVGQRWADWAVYENGSAMNQPYDSRRKGTYVTGACQVVSPEVRAAVSYSRRVFHDWRCDIGYCFDAVKQGFELCPPVHPNGPLLIHLDRLKPRREDPERLWVPF